MPCFGFPSLLCTGCPEQKWQTMEQYLEFNSVKALYILILQSLLRKFDIGANKRQISNIKTPTPRLTCIFSQVVGVFFAWYIAMIKEKKLQFWICHERHIFVATQIRLHFLLLSLTEFMQLAINFSTSYMTKNIRSHSGSTIYIYIQTSWIYTSPLRLSVPRKVLIA